MEYILETVQNISPTEEAHLITPTPQKSSEQEITSVRVKTSPRTKSALPKLMLERVLGYSGNTPDNLFWSAELGWVIYTLGNKVVQLFLQANEQQRILKRHNTHIGALALNSDNTILASGPKSPSDSRAEILL